MFRLGTTYLRWPSNYTLTELLSLYCCLNSFDSFQPAPPSSDQRVMFADTDLLWFVLPTEAADLLAGRLQLPLIPRPIFTPAQFKLVTTGEFWAL